MPSGMPLTACSTQPALAAIVPSPLTASLKRCPDTDRLKLRHYIAHHERSVLIIRSVNREITRRDFLNGALAGSGDVLGAAPFGRIAFANTDLSGTPDHKSSIIEADRALEQLLNLVLAE
jgi:hypothetical protein